MLMKGCNAQTWLVILIIFTFIKMIKPFIMSSSHMDSLIYILQSAIYGMPIHIIIQIITYKQYQKNPNQPQVKMYYIPTEQQRIKIYKKLNTNTNDNQNQGQNQNQNSNKNIANIEQKQQDQSQKNQENVRLYGNLQVNNEIQSKKMSKQAVKNLVSRLTKDTTHHSQLLQHIDRITVINKERKKKTQNAGKIQERLIQSGKQLQAKKQQLRQQKIKQEVDGLGNPTICPNSKKIVQKDKNNTKLFIQRVDELTNQKEQLMRKLKNKYQPNFKPKLNPYSIFMAQVQTSKNFLERVEQYNQQKKQNEQQRLKCKLEAQVQGATFNPQINKKSREIAVACASSSYRQSKSQSHKNSHREQAEDKDQLFNPKINKKSRQIILKLRSQSNCNSNFNSHSQSREKINQNSSNIGEFHERLYADSSKILSKIQQKRKQKDIEIKRMSKMGKMSRNSLKIIQSKYANARKNNNSYDNSVEQQYEQVAYEKQKLFPQQQQQPQQYKYCVQQSYLKQHQHQYQQVKPSINRVKHRITDSPSNSYNISQQQHQEQQYEYEQVKYTKVSNDTKVQKKQGKIGGSSMSNRMTDKYPHIASIMTNINAHNSDNSKPSQYNQRSMYKFLR